MAREEVAGERLIVTLLNTARAKLDLIAFTGKDGQRDFALRKMVWTGALWAEHAVRGYEIKLDQAIAQTLRVALKRELEEIEEGRQDERGGGGMATPIARSA
jgi:hypothetical protein